MEKIINLIDFQKKYNISCDIELLREVCMKLKFSWHLSKDFIKETDIGIQKEHIATQISIYNNLDNQHYHIFEIDDYLEYYYNFCKHLKYEVISFKSSDINKIIKAIQIKSFL